MIIQHSELSYEDKHQIDSYLSNLGLNLDDVDITYTTIYYNLYREAIEYEEGVFYLGIFQGWKGNVIRTPYGELWHHVAKNNKILFLDAPRYNSTSYDYGSLFQGYKIQIK